MQMIGVCARLPSIGQEAIRKKICFPLVGINVTPPAGDEEGLWNYVGSSAANDRLLVVKGGNLYKATITANQPQPVADALYITMSDLTLITNNTGVSPPFTPGQRVRACQYKTEVFFVQDGGMLPVRFDGTALYKVGIAAPAAPTDGGDIGAGLLVAGTYSWYATYVDSFGRESDPSPALTISGIPANHGRQINYVASTDAQVVTINLYRTVQGPGPTLYRLATGLANTTSHYNDTTTSDTTLSAAGALTIRIGAQLTPTAATLCAIHKNRLVLNSTGDGEVLQFSNLDNPTQFPTVGNPLFPTDGQTMKVRNEFGDAIVCFATYGSGLAIWHTRSIYTILGDGPPASQGGMYILPVHKFGCIAPDSLTSCGNLLVFMGEDGIYALAYESGLTLQKLSNDMDNIFRQTAINFAPPGQYPPATTETRQARAQAALGFFCQNRYILATPPYVCVYDFEMQSWFLDYMNGMPYGYGDAGQSGYSHGYMSGIVVNVDRQYQIMVYNPGYAPLSGVNGGYLYAGSYYPLKPDGATDNWMLLFETRAIDGAGVPRQSQKTLVEATIFGDISGVFNTSGVQVSTPIWNGTITAIVEGVPPNAGIYEEAYSFDIYGNFAAQYARDQQEGVLVRQQFTSKVTGRVLRLRLQATVQGRLNLRNLQFKYRRLDPV